MDMGFNRKSRNILVCNYIIKTEERQWLNNLLPMEDSFLCQLVLATLVNTIAGVILCNLNDGKQPSNQDNNDLKIKTSFEIHCKTKSKTIVWIIILLCGGILLLF